VCGGAADGDDGSLRDHAVVRFPRGDVVERNLRAVLARCVPIHHDERSYEALSWNLASGPSPGNKSPGGDDASSGFRGIRRRRILCIGQVHHVRIAILLRGTGSPVGKQQNGEHEGVRDDENCESAFDSLTGSK